MRKGSILIGGLLLLFSTLNATVWYVHPDSALNSIQAGLDSCVDNDTVLVGPGIYQENIIWPNTDGVHLVSEFGPDTTIIDASYSGKCVITIEISIDTSTVIEGFTIQKGAGFYGGGIQMGECSPIIKNNIIKNNVASDGGGGLYCWGGAPVIMGNTIENNRTFESWAYGGGIMARHSRAVILNNTIINNRAIGGGGIQIMDDSSTVISYNIINHNIAFVGSGMYCLRMPEGIITHNTIDSNSAGVYCGGIYLYGSSPRITGNEILGNIVDTVSIEGAIAISGLYSYPFIDSCTICYNDEAGICITGDNNPIINYNDIFSNEGYAVWNKTSYNTVNAEDNWWGDATGPYHPTANPGGLGDSVSDYVDFIPWLYWPGVEERPAINSVVKHNTIGATIFAGPLALPEGGNCRVFDITGRGVAPDKIRPGIYFIEINRQITQKVVKVR